MRLHWNSPWLVDPQPLLVCGNGHSESCPVRLARVEPCPLRPLDRFPKWCRPGFSDRPRAARCGIEHDESMGAVRRGDRPGRGGLGVRIKSHSEPDCHGFGDVVVLRVCEPASVGERNPRGRSYSWRISMNAAQRSVKWPSRRSPSRRSSTRFPAPVPILMSVKSSPPSVTWSHQATGRLVLSRLR